MSLPYRFPDKPRKIALSTFADMPVTELAKHIAQRKYDGWRMPVYIDGANTVRCFSSAGNLMRDAYKGKMPPELEACFCELGLPDDTVLDAEFVGPRGGHQQAVYVFDLLAWEGRWIGSKPYEVRWQQCLDALKGKLRQDGLIQVAETLYPSADDPENIIVKEFHNLRREWIASGSGMEYLYEGLVVKHRAGKLVLNRSSLTTSSNMFKMRFRDIDNAEQY